MSRRSDKRGATEYAGQGDLTRSMELLWGIAPRGGRGPKPGLTLDEIVDVAIAIADADGLEALSMRRIAERLGAGTMSLYRYVPGRAELLDVMLDRVSAEASPPRGVGGGWRARLEHVARENARLSLRHPWMLQIFPGRPPMGPGVLKKYDEELRSVDRCGLSDVDMNMVLDLVLGYVRGAAMTWIEASRLEDRTGLSEHEWWAALAPTLERALKPEDYPLAMRVGEAATAHYGGVYNPELAFEFGLERVLDGIGAFIAARGRR